MHLCFFSAIRQTLTGMVMSSYSTAVRVGDAKTVETGSILTTPPNAVISAVHDRMPVILDPDSYDFWLDPGMNSVVEVSNLLTPYVARLMRCHPVSTRIKLRRQ
jgi:putative SOS response-associated peptidase YedK